MDRQSDNPRFKQEMDNYITGHWGEDSIPPEDEVSDMQPDNLTFTFDTTLTRIKADELLEFLNHLLNDDMHLETIVYYTINNKEDENEQEKPGTVS